MVSEVSRAGRIEEAIEKLLKMRSEIEEKIKELGRKEALIRAQKEDFDKEGAHFKQEMKKNDGLFSIEFSALRKVNIRIEEFKNPNFTENCPKCGKPLDLECHPMLKLCIGCQQKENNK